MFSRLFVLFLFLCSSDGDRKTCLSMHDFVQSYTSLESTVETLQAKLSSLRKSLNGGILESCQHEGITAVAPTFNLTYCNFENGMCNYTGYGQLKKATGQRFDHTYGSNNGYVIQTYNYNPAKSYTFTSPPFKKSSAYCVRFMYRSYEANTNFTGKINVYSRPIGTSFGNPLLTITTANSSWALGEIDVDREYLGSDIQFGFAAYGNTYALIDDVMIYNVHCTTLGVRSPLCPQGSFRRIENGHLSCYTIHVGPKSWFNAVDECKKIWPLASLVSIESAEEEAFLVSKITNDTGYSQAGTFGYWTSGHSLESDHSNFFQWIGSWKAFSETNYTNWFPGQPNNVGGEQHCVLMEYPNANYQWGDTNCNSSHPYICEAKSPLMDPFGQ